MDAKTLTYIQDNVVGATREEIDQAFVLHKGDVLETMSALLKIPVKVDAPKTVWETRREICDAFDAEMQKSLRKIT
jgi:hypothetical protein